MATKQTPVQIAELPLLGSLPKIIDHFANFLLISASKYGDAFTFSVLGKPAYFFNHPEIARDMLLTCWSTFRKLPPDGDPRENGLGRYLGKGLLTNDGDFWRKQRKLMQPALHAQRIRSYGDTMSDHTHQMLNGWQGGSIIKLKDEMMQLTLNIATQTLFGVEVNAYSELEEALTGVQRAAVADTRIPFYAPKWLPTPSNRRREILNTVLDRTVAQIVQARRITGQLDQADLLGMLMMARDDDGQPMAERQLRDEVITLFIAAHETTALTLTWALYLLSQHPESMLRVVAEVDQVLGGQPITVEHTRQLPYLRQVLDETLRLYPAGWLFPRYTAEQTTIAGYALPRGAFVMMSPYVMHRDPRFWNDPERFDPERFSETNKDQIQDYSYLPFGGGPRVCIGNTFALMEAQIVLATMLQKFNFTLVPGQKIVSEPLITIGPKYGIDFKISAR